MILDWLKESLENLFISRRKKRLRRKALKKRKTKKRSVSKRKVKRIRPKSSPRRSSRPKIPKKPVIPQRIERRPAAKPPAPKAGHDRMAELRRLRAASAYKTAPPAPLPRRVAPHPAKSGVLAGNVTHYFSKIQVAVIKVDRGLKVGDKIEVRRKGVGVGKDTVREMQINHIPIDEARKGEEIGLKLVIPSQSGDEIFIL